MDQIKKELLISNNWSVGDIEEFLGLTENDLLAIQNNIDHYFLNKNITKIKNDIVDFCLNNQIEKCVAFRQDDNNFIYFIKNFKNNDFLEIWTKTSELELEIYEKYDIMIHIEIYKTKEYFEHKSFIKVYEK